MTKPNGQPSLKLELEELCYSVLWVAKKKYIKNSLYSKKTVHQSLKEIKIKGLELNQSSTPLFVRKKLKDVVYHIMGGEATIKSIIDMMSVIKDEFKVVPIEMISKYERISNYEKTVINDTSGIELASGAKPHIKGAAMYNYMIKNSKYASKYERIRSGDRVHFYYTDTDIGSFSFLSGSCPIEIAPPINIDEQFDSVFLGALNNILKVLDMPKVTPDLLNIGSKLKENKRDNFLFILGNEKFGVPNKMIEIIKRFNNHLIISIPQWGCAHSYNVSQAANIIMWEYYRQNVTKKITLLN
jgi:hypothetical protein